MLWIKLLLFKTCMYVFSHLNMDAQHERIEVEAYSTQKSTYNWLCASRLMNLVLKDDVAAATADAVAAVIVIGYTVNATKSRNLC